MNEEQAGGLVSGNDFYHKMHIETKKFDVQCNKMDHIVCRMIRGLPQRQFENMAAFLYEDVRYYGFGS